MSNLNLTKDRLGPVMFRFTVPFFLFDPFTNIVWHRRYVYRRQIRNHRQCLGGRYRSAGTHPHSRS